MARIPLASMTRRVKPRKTRFAFRPVKVPATLASDLYAAGYAEVVAAWGNALPQIMAEYERTLASLATDSPADVSVRIERAEGVVATLMVTLRSRLARWAARFEAMHRRKWVASTLTATGVDLSTMIGPEAARQTLETVIERNVGLVRNVSEQARGRIADAVFRGLTQRKPAVDVARELREAVAMSRRRSLNIASDQASKLAGALDQERRREVGIAEWKWVSSGKLHFRPEHAARDGNIYSDDDPPSDMPGELINCGCSSAAYLDLDKLLAE